MGVRIEVRRNCLPAIASRLGPSAKTAVRDTLEQMGENARARARVDTGNMRDSTRVEGDTRLHAAAPYSGFLNYGTRRGIAADHWFDAPVTEGMGRIAPALQKAIADAAKC